MRFATYSGKWINFNLIKNSPAKFVLLYAVSVMIYFHMFYSFYHPGGDSDGNFFMARYILGIEGGQYVSYHSPGMALFLIFSGVLKHNSWYGMCLVYALMSVAIPFMIYLMISPYSKTWGAIVAGICITSFIPFAYSRVETYDHLFLFFEFLSFLLVSRCFYSSDKNCIYPYLIAIIMFITNLIKPILVFSFWIYLVCAFFIKSHTRKTLWTSMLLYLVLMGSWVLVDRNFGNGNFPEWSVPTNQYQRRFAETYFQPTPFLFTDTSTKTSVISAKDGSASKTLIDIIKKYTIDTKTVWGASTHSVDMTNYFPYELFGKYLSKPENLVDALFQKPNALYFNFIRRAIQQKMGAEVADTLLYQVAQEHGNSGIMGGVRYLIKNPMKLVTGATVSMGWRNLLGVYYFAYMRERYSWNIFVNSASVSNFLISPSAGPYSQEFFSALHFYVYEMTDYWEHHGVPFDEFTGDPSRLYAAFLNPDQGFMINNAPYSTIAEGWFYTLFNCIYGPSSSKLFTHVVYETLKKHPKTSLLFLDSFLNELFYMNPYKTNFPSKLSIYYRYFMGISELNYTKRINDFTHLTPGLSSELKHEVIGDKHSQFIAFVYSISHFLLPFLLISAILLFPCCIFGASKYFAVFILITYIYVATVLAVFGNFGSARYCDMYILLPLILTGLACSNFKYFGKRTTNLLDDRNAIGI